MCVCAVFFWPSKAVVPAAAASRLLAPRAAGEHKCLCEEEQVQRCIGQKCNAWQYSSAQVLQSDQVILSTISSACRSEK
jgi:hypothetical protein